MKIIYLHQYYRLPANSGSSRPYFLSRILANSNHIVHLITSHPDKHSFSTETIGNLTIHYIPSNYNQALGFWNRVTQFLNFSIQAHKIIKSIKDFEVIYASSTPLTIGYLALYYSIFKNKKYYFEVRDLWPQVPIQMGILKNPVFNFILIHTTNWIYKRADKVIAVSEGIFNALAPKYKQTYLINNFSSDVFFPYIDRAFDEQTINIVYFGAVGKANHLDNLLILAKKTTELNLPFHFFIVGEGSEKERIKAQVEKNNLFKTISFIEDIPKQELSLFLQKMHLSFISYANYPILDTSSPNKLYDSLSSGLIPITTTQGWIKETLLSQNAGLYFDYKNPNELVNSLKTLIMDRTLLKQMSINARSLYLARFRIEDIEKQFLALFTN